MTWVRAALSPLSAAVYTTWNWTALRLSAVHPLDPSHIQATAFVVIMESVERQIDRVDVSVRAEIGLQLGLASVIVDARVQGDEGL